MEEQKSSVGSIVSIIIILILIVIGALYFWGKRVEETTSLIQPAEEITPNEADEAMMNEAAAIKAMSGSDEIDSIEADLKATNLNNLDAELNVQPQ